MNLSEALKNKKTRIRLCYHRFDLFLLWYLRESFPVPFSPKHKELIQLLQDGKFEEFIVIAHRNFGKTLIVKGYILWLLCYNKVKFVIIAAHEGTKSKGHAFDIGLQLQVNKRIINDFGNLYWEDKEKDGLKKKLRKKEDWFLTTHGAMVKATQASIRGETFTDTTGTYRPDLVYYDDIENLNTIKSYTMTQKLIDNLGESKNAKAIGGRSIFAVNRLSSQGAVAFLEGRVDNEKIKKFEAKLIDAPLVQDKVNIIESAKKNIQWKTRYVATDLQKKIINEQADTKNKVESIETLLKDGLSVFMREYQNEPQEMMEMFVQPKDIKNNYYTVEDSKWKVCISIDPQSGMTAKSDEYAISVIGYNYHDPNRWVVEQVAGRASPTQQAKQFIELCLKYHGRLERAGIEVIKTQTAVYLTVLDWINGNITIEGLPKCEVELPVVKIGSKEDKETRLNRFVPAFERGEIHLKPDMLELEEQLIYFTNLPHDDRADSVVSCLELIKQTKGSIYEGTKTGYNNDSQDERDSIMGNLYKERF